VRVSAGIFRHVHRVTYAECTLGNHIYYARYLDLLEAARGEFFRHLGLTLVRLQDRDCIFPVIEARLRYRGAARYDDLLTVELWLTTAEKVRLNFASRILGPDGKLLVEGETAHVCTNLTDRPKRLPEDLLQRLQPYLHPTSEPGK
jgi:acyl-CoA thioester hydrolase